MMKVLVLLVSIFVISCSAANELVGSKDTKPKSPELSKNSVVVTPTIKLSQNQWPNMADDMDFEWMLLAIDRQLEKFRRLRRGPNIQLGNIRYPFSIFERSLREFRKLVVENQTCKLNNTRASCDNRFEKKLKEKFHLFAPIENGERKTTFFTAYHTPRIEASLTRSKDFPAGIHLRPQEEHLRRLTRNEINFDRRLAGTPYEAMYMRDYFDQYLLHVQGGGKVLYKDHQGRTASKYLTYDGTNSQSFRFISIYMRDMGYITNLSNENQRNFLNNNPDKQREIYGYSPSYVYFRFTEEPPHGNDAVSLTDNRSIATDHRIYRSKGLLTFVKVKRPVIENNRLRWVNMSRYFVDHDTGGAIRGPARADLYFGEDDYAAFVASNMSRHGDMYFLALKP